ncbi:MAG TPA: ATP-binding protein [Archangium sp.]|jgi:PAS domain S-box-containing protein|uniref:ATP-binding protein n=1 Tax=Archangium sp. TaxID=1872627 RepID=UPI002EDAAA15
MTTTLLVVGVPGAELEELKGMLAPLGQPVQVASPWSEELLARFEEPLACVLVDARQGWELGFKTAQRLRDHERAPHLPLLLLGENSCDEASLLRAYGLGTVDCLLEPLHPDVLRAKVGMFIELHRRERAMREALDRAEHAEAIARESERVLSTLLGNLPGMAYRCENEPGFPVSYASPGVLPLTGYTPEDFTERRMLWDELIHPEDAQKVWEEVQAAVEARTPFTLTYRIRTRSGEERWVWERGVAIHGARGEFQMLEGFITDITALHRAELHQSFLASVSETLASSLDYEATLAHVVQRAVPYLGDGCSLDIVESDGTLRRLAVAHVDPARAELTWELARRYPPRHDAPCGPGTVIRTGHTSHLTHIPEEIFARYAVDRQHLELLRNVGVTSALMVPLHARGRTFGVLSLVYCRPGQHHDAEARLLAEDLARRAALAVDNARLYREAQLAVQLRDEFLSVASHELKTPLTPLHLKLTTLTRELQQRAGEAGSERLLRHVEVAQRQIRKMATLINALLDVSRLSQGKLKLEPTDMDLAELVGEVATWFAPEAARAGSELRVEGETRAPGRWDRLRLEQVVTNLLSNAIRYGAGRPILARVEVVEDRVRLVVRDEGIGIPPEAQERIFGKFERAVSDRHYGGLGLGLYIARSIVEALGGGIRVESCLGKGSTFIIDLPR